MSIHSFASNISPIPPFSRQLRGKTALFYTLGCKLNFAETSTIGQELALQGVTRFDTSRGGEPDICIINTCSVTDMADKKCRSVIRKLHRSYPRAIIVVTGCYAQLKGDEIRKMEGVSLVVGAGRKTEVVPLLASLFAGEITATDTFFGAGREHLHLFEGGCSSEDRTRHFLKVQDGCDYFCSYCTIPFARGRSRNGSIAELVEQARKVVSEGGKELVLTGVNIGDYGKSTGESLPNLLFALSQVEGIERIRIGSVEPDLLTDELIDLVADPTNKIMPHFHLPLQAGNNVVLKLMRRHYDCALFEDRLMRIKKLIPEAFIGVDVIAGMRGETLELFQEGYNFIESLPWTRLHVFPYSERAGTKALSITPIVDKAEKEHRAHQLITLSDARLLSFYKEAQGKQRPVLWEKTQTRGLMLGFTDNYIRVAMTYDPARVGAVEKVLLGAPSPDGSYCGVQETNPLSLLTYLQE